MLRFAALISLTALSAFSAPITLTILSGTKQASASGFIFGPGANFGVKPFRVRATYIRSLPSQKPNTLQKIYDSEINIRIGWIWDGGMDVELGEGLDGFVAEQVVKSATGILPWLQEAIAHFYPESDYARSLGQDVIKRAANRVFRAPKPFVSRLVS